MPKILAPFLVVAVGLAGAVALVRAKAPVETSRPAVVVPQVQVVEVRIGELPMTVAAQGTVVPRTETTLAAQVAAEVVAVSPHFEAGGFFGRGEVLIRLDRRDYELAVERAAARVAQARLGVAQQQAEARVAADEWRQLGDGEPDPLVLREPQLAEARAALSAAEAELGMARLALDRTVIRAPFDGRVHDKKADVGQYLTPGQEVATVHAIDYAEVRLPVPDRQLAFLDLPLRYHDGEADRSQPAAMLSANFAGRRHRWPGRVVRAEGELDQRSRMLHLVVRVEDPYGRQRPGRPPLAVGLFVDAEITGRTVTGMTLPRAALRADDRVLVAEDADASQDPSGATRLRWREVDVVRLDQELVVIGGGLRTGEKVCVSPLDIVVDGMEVRVLEVEAPALPGEPSTATADPATAVATTAVAEEATVDDVPARVAEMPAEAEPVAVTRPERQPSAALDGRLLAVSLMEGGTDATTMAARIGGPFSYSTSRMGSPERFVVDLIGVVKVNPRAEVAVAVGFVERVRIGQFQAVPEPITRIVFDLQSVLPDGSSPAVERTDQGLTVTF